MFSSRDVRFNEEDFTFNKYLREEEGINFTKSAIERREIDCPIIRTKEVSGEKGVGSSRLPYERETGTETVGPSQLANKEVTGINHPNKSNINETTKTSPTDTLEDESDQTLSDSVMISDSPTFDTEEQNPSTSSKKNQGNGQIAIVENRPAPKHRRG